ncbi:MAG: hypothetical protein QOG65_1025, partial [Actinomycetota bacterium]|nr:hypothetical protein [Actinomycetota bacterium]
GPEEVAEVLAAGPPSQESPAPAVAGPE